MKKKLILGVAAAMFTAITMVNINLAMKVYNGDVSLESIAIMAQAQSSGDTPPPPPPPPPKYVKTYCNCYWAGVKKASNYQGSIVICTQHEAGGDCTPSTCSPGSSCVF
jgi:hypothetical protein